MHNKLLISAIIFSSFVAKAQQIKQQVVNSSGSVFSNNSISISFNVGEPTTSMLSSNDNILTQGFIQPIKSDVPTALKEFAQMDDNFMLFPNPSVGSVNLTINEPKTTLTRVDVYANDGRLVLSKTLTNNSFEMSSLSDGNYWIRPISNDKQFSLKKIVKTH
jgi:Secretion system C-terminal sorting domain